MADVSMKDFLLQYYMQLRFNQMPAEVRAQYDVYVNSNDFRGNMRDWRSKLMHDNGNGRFVQNDLPDPNDTNGDYHLTDAEWEKLFKAYQNALREMAAARAGGDEVFKDNRPVNEFIDEYFGDARTHLFANAPVVAGYDTQLDNINAIFNAYPQLEYVLDGHQPSFSDLKSGIASRKYNTDPKFQSQLIRIIGFLSYKVNTDANVAQWFGNIDLDDIARNAFADTTVDQNKLDYFKRNHQTMLNILYGNNKIFNVFKNCDGGKISGRIDAAREKLKYDDPNSDDYVPPKRDDELTPVQQLSRWADDTYDNLLDKYLKFHGDRLYFSKNAENIVKAINGAKVKPTDGIEGVLKNADNIKKNLLYKSPTATSHFDWFVKTMKEMQSTMKKAFEGALKNGRQMRAIVSEIIMKAVRDGKVEEAKTTLEVLSVIKYGATTSRVMDALGKEKLSVFSDGKLSWNKAKGVQFVTNALDKSIKFAFMGIGYGVTIVGNEIRLSGSKFNGNRGRMQSAQEGWVRKNDQDRQELITKNTTDAAQIRVQQQIQQNANTRGTTINNQNYAQLVNTNQIEIQRLDRLVQSQNFQDAQNNVNRMDEINLNLPNIRQQIQPLDAERINIEQTLANQNAFANLPPASANALANQLATRLREIHAELGPLRQQEQDYLNDQTRITTDPDWQNQQQIVQNYNNDRNAANTERNRLNEWHSANDAIQELNRNINNRDAELATWDDNHKDQYMELMAYWDMLETGRDSHMGKMYNWLPRGKKAAQTSFNAQKNAIINNYLNGYSYAS